MRHLLLLLIIALIGYFGWFYAHNRQRNEVRGFLATHVLKVILILVTLLLGLIAQFFFNSTKLL